MVIALDYSPDGKYLVAGTEVRADGKSVEQDGELFVWESGKYALHKSIQMPHWVRDFSFSPKGDLLAVAIGWDRNAQKIDEKAPGQVRIYSFPEMKEKGRLEIGLCVNSVSFSADGKLLATASQRTRQTSGTLADWSAEVKVWDVDSLKLKYQVDKMRIVMSHVQFSPDGGLLGVADWMDPDKDGRTMQIRQLSPQTGRPLNEIKGYVDVQFKYFPDGSKLVSRFLSTWDATSGKFLERYDYPELQKGGKRGCHIAIAKDGSHIVAGLSRDNSRPRNRPAHVGLFDVPKSKMVHEIRFPDEPRIHVHSIAISPDKQKVAVGADRVYLVEVNLR